MRNKKTKLLIGFAIVAIIGVLVFLFLRKETWKVSRWQHGSLTEKDNPTSCCMADFRVREYLKTKFILDLNIKSGTYYAKVYMVPENDVNYLVISATSAEEIAKLVSRGIKMQITDNLELVYEGSYSQSGKYVIDTADCEPGVYLLVTSGSEDVNVDYTISFKYAQYNWMVLDKRIKSLYSDEFDMEDKYTPY